MSRLVGNVFQLAPLLSGQGGSELHDGLSKSVEEPSRKEELEVRQVLLLGEISFIGRDIFNEHFVTCKSPAHAVALWRDPWHPSAPPSSGVRAERLA